MSSSMDLTPREILASVHVEENGDNLSIVLCTYFAHHLDRPEEDEAGENEDNHYWGDWVCRKTDEALDIIAGAIKKGKLP